MLSFITLRVHNRHKQTSFNSKMTRLLIGGYISFGACNEVKVQMIVMCLSSGVHVVQNVNLVYTYIDISFYFAFVLQNIFTYVSVSGSA